MKGGRGENTRHKQIKKKTKEPVDWIDAMLEGWRCRVSAMLGGTSAWVLGAVSAQWVCRECTVSAGAVRWCDVRWGAMRCGAMSECGVSAVQHKWEQHKWIAVVTRCRLRWWSAGECNAWKTDSAWIKSECTWKKWVQPLLGEPKERVSEWTQSWKVSACAVSEEVVHAWYEVHVQCDVMCSACDVSSSSASVQVVVGRRYTLINSKTYKSQKKGRRDRSSNNQSIFRLKRNSNCNKRN